MQWRKRITTADVPKGQGGEEHGAEAGQGRYCRRVRAEDAAAAERCPRLLEGQHASSELPRLVRCLQRYDISRLQVEETAEKRKRFKTYEISHVHIDSCDYVPPTAGW